MTTKKDTNAIHSFVNPDNGDTQVGPLGKLKGLEKEGYEDRGPVTHPDFVVGDELRPDAHEDVNTHVIDEDGLPADS